MKRLNVINLVGVISVVAVLSGSNAIAQTSGDNLVRFAPRFISTESGLGHSHPDTLIEEERFVPIVSCDDDMAIIESDVVNPEKQRLVLRNYNAIRYLGINWDGRVEGKGDSAVSGSAFKGFSSQDIYFPQYLVHGPIHKKFHVFRDYGGLKVKVDIAPHYFCHYYRPLGISTEPYTHAAPIGYSCPRPRSTHSLSHTSVGSDVPKSKDWFFQNCKNL